MHFDLISRGANYP